MCVRVSVQQFLFAYRSPLLCNLKTLHYSIDRLLHMRLYWHIDISKAWKYNLELPCSLFISYVYTFIVGLLCVIYLASDFIRFVIIVLQHLHFYATRDTAITTTFHMPFLHLYKTITHALLQGKQPQRLTSLLHLNQKYTWNIYFHFFWWLVCLNGKLLTIVKLTFIHQQTATGLCRVMI